MGANPFLGCKNLKTITVDEGNEYFETEDNVLYNAGKTLLLACPPGKAEDSFTSPGTVEGVASNAFGTCTGLSEINLSGVTTVNDWASEYCNSLETLKFGAPGFISFGTNVFSGVATPSINLYLNVSGEEYVNNVQGCKWKDYEWKSVNATTGIPKMPVAEKPPLFLYPNPVKDVLHINSHETINCVAIYDTNAKMVLQTNHTGNGIDMSSLPDGLYIVGITSESGVKKEPVLKTQ
jgi:hypothetical protein